MNIPTISNIYLKIAAVVVCAAIILACRFYFKVPDNNPVEVMAEEVITQETGCDVSKL